MPGPSSDIARRAFMNSSRIPMASRDYRSTLRIASIAKRGDSRARPRTSTGSRPKAGEDPISRTCRLFAGTAAVALLIVASPAAAKLKVALGDPGLVYLQARAASLTGDHARSAQLLTSLAQAQPSQIHLNRQAASGPAQPGNKGVALPHA